VGIQVKDKTKTVKSCGLESQYPLPNRLMAG
jgi:hypothetical protein